jgi:glycerophosphoryl diester phosphodiesterase
MGLSADFSIIGHRGAAGIEPENTLRGFKRALEHQVHAVEFDVYRIDRELGSPLPGIFRGPLGPLSK